MPSEIGRSDRHTIASGVMPMERSDCTECCVGLLFCSPDGARYGTSDTCRKKTLSRPTSWRTWRGGRAGGLEQRQQLDAAEVAADLGDDDVDVLGGHRPDPGLDLVRDVRDDL